MKRNTIIIYILLGVIVLLAGMILGLLLTKPKVLTPPDTQYPLTDPKPTEPEIKPTTPQVDDPNEDENLVDVIDPSQKPIENITSLPGKKTTNIITKSYNGRNYIVYTKQYAGEYSYEQKTFERNSKNTLENKETAKEFSIRKVVSYDDYVTYCKKWNLKQKYGDKTKNYYIIAYAEDAKNTVQATLADVTQDQGNVTVYINETVSGDMPYLRGYAIIVPVEKYSSYFPGLIVVYSQSEFDKIASGNDTTRYTIATKKPVIYIYPEHDMNVSIKLLNKDRLTVTYPKYINGWNVFAKTNGTLIDSTGRELYSLYYEVDNTYNYQVTDTGFIVKGEDTISFLEEKLSLLGLNSKEAEEFIIYWLPILQSNKYNYIRFATQEEINANMELEITPKPDNLIRIVMTYKGLEKPIKVKEQKLKTPSRAGYTVVEWGGTEIK